MSAFDRLVSALEGHGSRVRHSGGATQATCPAHEDRNPSLSLRPIEGSVLLHCHGGCRVDDVLAVLDLTKRDLYDEPRGNELARYQYTDAAGQPTRTVHRYEGKTFSQTGDKKTAQLYRLPQVVEAVRAGRPVYLVEGEKDVHAVESCGEVATTAPQGASNFHKVDVAPLKGARVIAVADNDAAGEKWATTVRERLGGYAADLKLVHAAEGKDAADHIAAGHSLDAFRPIEAPGWEDDPLPLGWQTRLPAFPVDALPGLIGRYAAALSVETQTPPDLAGTIVLGTIAACIGGRVRVYIRRGWVEPTNTYTVPVLAPGSRKSAVVAACEAPLDAAEKALLEEMAEPIRNAMIERDIREKYADQLKQKAGKAPDAISIMEAQEATRVATEIEVPAWPRLLTDDATPEQLVKLMADQKGRIAAITAEAGIFDNFAGRYTARINLEPLLKAHAGDSIRVDRRSRDPERVDRPALTMIATIQPYALRDMVSRPEFGGRGLLARVLWCLPADVVGYRDENAPPVPEDLAADYRRFIEHLAIDMAKRDDDMVLGLTEQAYKVLIEYLRQVEVMLRNDGPLGASRLIKDWGSKLVGAVARISGALHIAAGRSHVEPVSEETMSAAVQLGEYYRAHAIAALGPTEDKRVEAARKVLEVATAKDMHAFTMRELTRRMPRALQNADELAKLLDYLTDLGWTRKAGKGWELHPRAADMLQGADSADSADNTHEPGGQSDQATVSTAADSADSSWRGIQSVSTVSTGADGAQIAVTSEKALAVSAVSAVSNFTDRCPLCSAPVMRGSDCPICFPTATQGATP